MLDNPDANNQTKCAQITVFGRVQGVGFRYFTQTVAKRYGLVGWVRNNYNGTVEILVEGQQNDLDNFIQSIRNGCSSSHVRKVDIEWRLPTGKYTSFFIRT